MDEPTELTIADIDAFVKMMEEQEIQWRQCFKCGKDFLPNYDIEKCDGCWFAMFPKEEREAYYRRIFDDMMGKNK